MTASIFQTCVMTPLNNVEIREIKILHRPHRELCYLVFLQTRCCKEAYAFDAGKFGVLPQ